MKQLLCEFADDVGRSVEMMWPPQRIISLCPSITETLYTLGLSSRVVGRTRFCIHPQPDVMSAENIGGTKQVDFERVAKLFPDLMIAEKEENTRDTVSVLEQSYPVYVANVTSVASAVKLIRNLGDLTGSAERATSLAASVEAKVRQVASVFPRTMAYLIWEKPYMGVGANTYLHDLLAHFGFVNVLAGRAERYPEISLTELQRLRPEVVFLSSEPFPFDRRHQTALQAVLPKTRVVLVDGEISWYGARMEWAFPYLEQVVANLTE